MQSTAHRSVRQLLLRSIVSVVATALIMLSLSSRAHHSFAVFDFETQIPFEGTVETLKFRNPHIEMTLKSIDEHGNEKIIHFIEGSPANMLVRSGLKPDMIKVGTHLTAVGSPLIDDPDKFFLRKFILDDGTEY